jgi:peptidoglycan/xylan/chitin deacetylase (PgdA/CDA1 family)
VPIASITIDAEFPDQPARDPLGALDEILEVLARGDVRATFFLVGQWAEANSKHVAAIKQAGHGIGNHSHAHRPLPTLTETEIVEDLTACRQALANFGVETRPWFRAPRGELGQENRGTVMGAINRAGYRHIHWHARGEDWRPDLPPEDVATMVLRDVEKRWPSPAIVLLHSWPDSAPKALELVIDRLQADGAKFRTVDQLGRRHAATGRLRALAGSLQTSHRKTE